MCMHATNTRFQEARVRKQLLSPFGCHLPDDHLTFSHHGTKRNRRPTSITLSITELTRPGSLCRDGMKMMRPPHGKLTPLT